METKLKSLKDESRLRLFLRFLRYGFLAWGGPIAQLALIRRELVDELKLVSESLFNRLIAIYQLIPGPEAHEICVYLGTSSHGAFGGLLAGLGFMLPGFVLTILVAWAYTMFGITPFFLSVLLGTKPAVMAWITSGGFHLGKSILVSYYLWLVAIIAFIMQLLNLHFAIIFLLSGLLYLFLMRKKRTAEKHTSLKLKCIILLSMTFIVICGMITLFAAGLMAGGAIEQVTGYRPTLWATFLLGLKAGGLSFGSVYSVISIIKTDAVTAGRWMTHGQLIDGLALTGALPAPFIIITTFCGFLASGFWGSILATFGTFLPAFLIPIFFHYHLDRLSENISIRIILDGITAGAAGLIAAEILDILRRVIVDTPTTGIFFASLLAIFLLRSSYSIVWVVLGGALVGILLGS